MSERPYEYLCHAFVANLPLDDTRKEFRELWKTINKEFDKLKKELREKAREKE